MKNGSQKTLHYIYCIMQPFPMMFNQTKRMINRYIENETSNMIIQERHYLVIIHSKKYGRILSNNKTYLSIIFQKLRLNL